MDLTQVRWRKASYSGGDGGGCVEVSATVDTASVPRKANEDLLYLLGDSKNPRGPKLAFTTAEWDAFIADGNNPLSREELIQNAAHSVAKNSCEEESDSPVKPASQNAGCPSHRSTTARAKHGSGTRCMAIPGSGIWMAIPDQSHDS